MAGVKLVVIYPRPKDIEVFEKLYQEKLYQEEPRPDGGRQARRQNEVYSNQGRDNPGWDIPSILPNRRSSYPAPGGIATVCVDDHTVDRFLRGYDPQLKRNRRK